MYLNQKAQWKSITVAPKHNNYGDAAYTEDDITIDVRRQPHIEEIRTPDGTLHHTNYIYYTYANVKIDDRLDGNLVVSVYDMISLGGKSVLRRLKTI